MSPPRARAPTGARAALRARRRAIAGAVLAGALAGYLWGIADQPVYSSSASVLIAERPLDGGIGLLGPSDGAAERLAELARSTEVARAAAVALGEEAPGADLLGEVTAFPGRAPGVLVIRVQSELPDLAAAAADAWTTALVDVVADRERRRLDRLADRLGEELEALDPLSLEAGELAEQLAEVERLAALDEPVEVGRAAELPRSPASDRPALLWAGGGGLAGLLLGAVLALLAGRRAGPPVRDPAALARVLRAPRLGAIPAAALPDLRAAVVELNRPALATHRALVRDLGIGTGESRALAVTSADRGEGRTAVACGLAAAAAIDGARVLLVEADLANPGLAEQLELPAGPGLAEYLTGVASPREVLNTVRVRRVPDAGGTEPVFVCVFAGRRLEAARRELRGPRFPELVDRLRRVYDLVLLDTAALLSRPEAAAVAAAADSAVVCAVAGRTTTRQLARSVELLDSAAVAGGALTDAG